MAEHVVDRALGHAGLAGDGGHGGAVQAAGDHRALHRVEDAGLALGDGKTWRTAAPSAAVRRSGALVRLVGHAISTP